MIKINSLFVKQLLSTLTILLVFTSLSGQIQFATHVGLSINYNNVDTDTGLLIEANTAAPTLRYGMTLGYSFSRLTVELDYTVLETTMGYSVNAFALANPGFGFGGSTSVFEGFSRVGVQAKYNFAKNPNAFQVSPIVGVGLVFSGDELGVNGTSKGTSGSDGLTSFASVSETAYLDNQALQLSLGAEFGVFLSRRLELYLNVIYSVGTSDVYVTDLDYEANTPAIEDLTIDDLVPGLLMEEARIVNRLNMFHSSVGLRLRFGSTHVPSGEVK